MHDMDLARPLDRSRLLKGIGVFSAVGARSRRRAPRRRYSPTATALRDSCPRTTASCPCGEGEERKEREEGAVDPERACRHDRAGEILAEDRQSRDRDAGADCQPERNRDECLGADHRFDLPLARTDQSQQREFARPFGGRSARLTATLNATMAERRTGDFCPATGGRTARRPRPASSRASGSGRRPSDRPYETASSRARVLQRGLGREVTTSAKPSGRVYVAATRSVTCAPSPSQTLTRSPLRQPKFRILATHRERAPVEIRHRPRQLRDRSRRQPPIDGPGGCAHCSVFCATTTEVAKIQTLRLRAPGVPSPPCSPATFGPSSA